MTEETDGRYTEDECLKLIWSKKKDCIVVTGEATEEQKKKKTVERE